MQQLLAPRRSPEVFANHMAFCMAKGVFLPDFGIPLELRPAIEAHAGVVVGLRAVRGVERAYLDPAGEFHLAIKAIAADGETVCDLVLWRPDRPDDFATAAGEAVGLGVSQVMNPTTYVGRWPLLVHRTPLKWIRSGCRGVVILDRRMAPRWLAEAPGSIAGEDAEHAHELARLLHGYFDPNRIMRPSL